MEGRADGLPLTREDTTAHRASYQGIESMKITNKWHSFQTTVIHYKVELSGGQGNVDEGTINYGETYEVPPDKFDPADAVFKLNVISVNESTGKLYVNGLTRSAEVVITINPPRG
jgi:hypothetical protein